MIIQKACAGGERTFMRSQTLIIIASILRKLRNARAKERDRDIFILNMLAQASGKLRILSGLEGSRKEVSYYIQKQCCHTSKFLTICRKLCSNYIQQQCWKCGSEIQNSSLFCSLCSTLQKPDESKTYFDILRIKQGFEVEDEDLTTKYRKLQNVLHPDRFSVKNAVR